VVTAPRTKGNAQPLLQDAASNTTSYACTWINQHSNLHLDLVSRVVGRLAMWFSASREEKTLHPLAQRGIVRRPHE